MRIAILILGVFLPVVALAALPTTPEYHANIVTITFIEEAVLSVLFFMVNAASTLFYTEIGPYYSFALVYFFITMFYMYKNILTARFDQMFSTIYQSPTNNLLTKTLLFYIAMHTVLLPVSVDMYKLGGVQTDSVIYDMTLQKVPENRIRDKNSDTVEGMFHDNVKTLTNEEVSQKITDAASSDIYIENVAPLVVAAPINFFQSILYGVPFLTKEDSVDGAVIEGNDSLMNKLNYYFPPTAEVYHEIARNPSTMVDLYLDYFSVVTETTNFKKGFLGTYNRYIKFLRDAFAQEPTAESNRTFTFVLPKTQGKKTAKGETVENDDQGRAHSEYMKSIVETVVAKYKSYVSSHAASLIQSNSLDPVLIKKLAILEFLSFFGFESEISDSNFYTALNEVFAGASSSGSINQASFVSSSDANYHKSLVLKVASIIFVADSDYYFREDMELTENDIKYLYQRLHKKYTNDIYKRYVDQAVTMENFESFELPTITHPLAGVYANLEVSKKQNEMLDAISKIFVAYYNNIESWLDKDDDKYEPIKNAYKGLMGVLYQDFGEGEKSKFKVQEHINVNDILSKTTAYFNLLIQINKKRRIEFIDEMVEKRLMEKFAGFDIYDNTILSFLAVAAAGVNDRNISVSLSSNPLIPLKEAGSLSTVQKIRMQDESIETGFYDDYKSGLDTLVSQLMAGNSVHGSGLYVVNRRTKPVGVVWNSSNNSVSLASQSQNQTLTDNYNNYVYVSNFNDLLKDLYNKADNLLSLKYSDAVLYKNTEKMSLKGYELIRDKVSSLGRFSQILFKKSTVVNYYGDSILEDFDPQSNAVKVKVAPKDSESAPDSSQVISFYQEKVLDENTAGLYKVIVDYEDYMDFEVLTNLEEQYDGFYDDVSTSDSTKMFKFKTYASEGIPALIGAEYQKSLFDFVLADVRAGFSFYTLIVELLNTTDGDDFEKVMGLSQSDAAAKSIEGMLTFYMDNHDDIEDQRGDEDLNDFMFSNLMKKILGSMYIPVVNGFHAWDNEDIDVKKEEFVEVGLYIAGLVALEAASSWAGKFPGVGKIVGALAQAGKYAMIFMAINGIIMAFVMIFVMIMIFGLFKAYAISISKSIWLLCSSIYSFMKEITTSQDVHKALDALFDAALRTLFFQLIIVILLVGSLVYTGVVSYMMTTFYLEEIFYKSFSFIDNLTLIVFFGVFTVYYLKFLLFASGKITREEAYASIRATEGFGSKAMAFGRKWASNQIEGAGDSVSRLADYKASKATREANAQAMAMKNEDLLAAINNLSQNVANSNNAPAPAPAPTPNANPNALSRTHVPTTAWTEGFAAVRRSQL